jgi:hypothetical protein
LARRPAEVGDSTLFFGVIAIELGAGLLLVSSPKGERGTAVGVLCRVTGRGEPKLLSPACAGVKSPGDIMFSFMGVDIFPPYLTYLPAP